MSVYIDKYIGLGTQLFGLDTPLFGLGTPLFGLGTRRFGLVAKRPGTTYVVIPPPMWLVKSGGFDGQILLVLIGIL